MTSRSGQISVVYKEMLATNSLYVELTRDV